MPLPSALLDIFRKPLFWMFLLTCSTQTISQTELFVKLKRVLSGEKHLTRRNDSRHNYKPEDYEVLAEELPNLNISQVLQDKIGSWLDHAVDATNTNGYYKKGKDFELWIKSQLTSNQTAVYQSLKLAFSADNWNLDDYSIYSQVQFCINGGPICNDEGTYFIADLVFVKEVTNPITGIKELDIKIADTKLSSSTDFTKNQKEAMKLNRLLIRTDQPTLVKGNRITLFNHPNNFSNPKKIYKVYSNGTVNTYGGVK
jgi:hypothetical protein